MGNVIEEKTFSFAVKVVKLSRELRRRNELEISSQLLRSGTSIGANVAEAQEAESRSDFAHKMSIELKEAVETKYWLRLIKAVEMHDVNETAKLVSEVEEMIRILTSILKSTRESLRDKK